MSINLQIQQAKESIIKAINDTHLPISILVMILDDLTRSIHTAEQQVLAQEKQQEIEKQQKAQAEQDEKTKDTKE